ncbi:MAG: DUF3137 domain-containing protein [Candidatus Phytoplasma sp.]|nr:DUF3137 domain-containing protein [Phytoplasma sp.]
MKKKLETLEKLREEQYKKYIRMTAIGGFFLVVAIISLIFDFYIGMIIGMIIAVVMFVLSHSEKTKFSNMYKDQLMLALLTDMYEEPTYNRKGSIPRSVIDSTKLTARADRFTGEDHITGKYKGVSFEVCDVRMEELRTTSNGKTTTTTYVTYFLGRWMIFRFNRDFKEELRIVEKGLFGASYMPKKQVKVETESIEFNKKFRISATSEQYAFYQITPSMLEKLQTLEKMFKGHISFLFRGNELHIAINDNKNTLEPKFHTKLTEESIKPHLIDIDIFAAIINEFKLDSAKFQESSQ